jgi:ribose transport system permease protein
VTRRADPAVAARLAVAAATFGLFAGLDTNFASQGSLYAMLQAIAFTGMVALGIGMTMLAGELDLSVGSLAATAGIVAVKLASIGLVPVVLVVFAGSLVYGALQGYVIAKLRVNSLVFTIGTLIALRGVAYILAKNQSVPLDFNLLTLSDDVVQRFFVFSPFSLLTLAAFVGVGLALAYSRFGREIYAIGGGRNESRAAGVSQTRPIVLAFTSSAGLAGLAGGLASIAAGGASPFGFDTVLLTVVTAALIGGVSLYGGKGDVFGIFVGMATLQFLLTGLSSHGAAYYVQSMATGGLLLAFLVLEFATERGERRQTGALGRLFAGVRVDAPAA